MPTPMVHGSPDVEGSHAMTSFFYWLLSPQDYMPHGMCFLWQPELIALHVASDSAIALAYYSIPVARLAVLAGLPPADLEANVADRQRRSGASRGLPE
jgi:hypothetical protein